MMEHVVTVLYKISSKEVVGEECLRHGDAEVEQLTQQECRGPSSIGATVLLHLPGDVLSPGHQLLLALTKHVINHLGRMLSNDVINPLGSIAGPEAAREIEDYSLSYQSQGNPLVVIMIGLTLIFSQSTVVKFAPVY